MREFRHVVVDIDRQLEDAVRAKQQLDAERWREELRSRAMRLFAARTTKLTWSRALLKLLIEELYPDDLFTELVGNLDRVPTRRYPHVAAVALALRHSWRRDGLTRLAKRLRLSLATTNATNGRHTSNTPGHHVLDSPVRLGPVKALRFAPVRWDKSMRCCE